MNAAPPMPAVRAAALYLRSRGFALCKPDSREKKPTYPGWSARSLEATDFADGDQLGVLGGALSDGKCPGHSAVIVDLDSAAAVELADARLPETGMSEGRPGKLRSHRYYLVPNDSLPRWACSTAKQAATAATKKTGHPGPFLKHFAAREAGAGGIDFIGTGGQVVCPPSMWTSRDGTRTERREWTGGEPGVPAIVKFLDLWKAVFALAEACNCRMPTDPGAPRRPVVHPVGGAAVGLTLSDLVTRRVLPWLAKCPPAVSGQNGHGALFWAARGLVRGFLLDRDTALQVLTDHFNPRCQPEWSDRELRHKIDDAETEAFNKPDGWLLNSPLPERNGRYRDTGPRASARPPCESGPPGEPPTGAGASAYTSGASPGPVFTDTDIANGRRFVADHGGNVRFVADWGQWVVYDGRRWAVDRSETRVESLAKRTADGMALEAAGVVGAIANEIATTSAEDKAAHERLKKRDQNARAVLKHAKASADMRAIGRMLHAARSEPAICVAEGGKLFDTRRDLLNCPNGTIELRTGTLREHRRDDFITRLCPTRFDPAAPRNEYVAFLDRVFDGKPAVAKYVRELSGYVVTGEVSDQTLHIFNGDGSNGKNVLVDTWKAVLGEGEYGHTAAAELLVGDGWERHPTEKTGLRGARLVICSETGEDGQLDETKMKALTGGDTVTARYMRGDFFEFEPTHKLALLTNNRPRVRGTDHGVWRRLRLVPFAVRFWKEADKHLDPDTDYPEKFKADPAIGERLRTAEAAGVLADMVEYAAGFYRGNGTLNPPAEVSGATAEYRADQDTIGQFFDARVRADDKGEGVKASQLYKAFKAWWEAEGCALKFVPSQAKFGREAKRKFKFSRPSGIVYHVRLLPEPDTEGSEG